jgi:hypothetical protein
MKDTGSMICKRLSPNSYEPGTGGRSGNRTSRKFHPASDSRVSNSERVDMNSTKN